MLTRLKVKGFKNLLDVDVYFGPFTCIVGPNGAGKSNLFDAIHFLHLLSQYPIMEAAQRLRESKGRSPEPRSLFSTFGSHIQSEIRFSAELIVERDVQDDFGVKASASISTVEYEVAFELRNDDGAERLTLLSETLKHIKLSEAKRRLGFKAGKDFIESCIKGRHIGEFISTKTERDEPEIRVHQEGHGGRRLSAPKSQRTVVGGMTSSDYPTILAVQREFQSWRTLLLEPSAMRAPSLYQDERVIDSRGGNLPATIFRLQRGDKSSGSTCGELACRLSELIEDVHRIQIRDDPKTETLTLEVKGRDGAFHPARSLSDGTLRFLVLTTLAYDPQVRGVICLEEPENGIHPERITAMVRLLKDIAVDSEREVGPENPLRQVVVNTHSTEVFQNVEKSDLVYFDEENRPINGTRARVASVKVPYGEWRAKGLTPDKILAPGKIQSYLGGTAPTKSRQLWFDFARSVTAQR